jgi:hypothetical protein
MLQWPQLGEPLRQAASHEPDSEVRDLLQLAAQVSGQVS